MTDGPYRVSGIVKIDPDGTGNGIRIEKGAKVLLFIDEGAKLIVTGRDASANDVGHAAILLPAGSSLTVTGYGTLEATGGAAGNGSRGGNAEYSSYDDGFDVGKGGDGGSGGAGAGAGIGIDGGKGGAGGAGGDGFYKGADGSFVSNNSYLEVERIRAEHANDPEG